jgi:signal peptidase II
MGGAAFQLAATAAVALIVDQGVKAAALAGAVRSVRLVSLPEAWGRPRLFMVGGSARTLLWVLTVALLMVRLGSGASVAEAAGWGAAVGGAASNSVDRAVRGSVVDFSMVTWWPAFNAADVAIVIGVVVAAVGATVSA